MMFEICLKEILVEKLGAHIGFLNLESFSSQSELCEEEWSYISGGA